MWLSSESVSLLLINSSPLRFCLTYAHKFNLFITSYFTFYNCSVSEHFEQHTGIYLSFAYIRYFSIFMEMFALDEPVYALLFGYI